MMNLPNDTPLKFALVATAIFLLTTCSSVSPIVQRGGVGTASTPLRISPGRPRVPLNGTLNVRLETTDLGIPVVAPVIWTSTDPDVAFVTGITHEAMIQGRQVGRVTITATAADGLTATANVRVVP